MYIDHMNLVRWNKFIRQPTDQSLRHIAAADESNV
jgi:hypothetical protein